MQQSFGILDRNPAITLKDLNAELRRQLPSKPTITDRHLGRICRGMLYTVKKLETAPVDRYVTSFSNFTIFYKNEISFNVFLAETDTM